MEEKAREAQEGAEKKQQQNTLQNCAGANQFQEQLRGANQEQEWQGTPE